MGWFSVIVCIVPVYLFFREGNTPLGVVSTINVIVQFCSFGIMHNYAMRPNIDRAKRIRANMELEGRDIDDEAEAALHRIANNITPNAVPDWIATVNLISFVAGVILIIASFIV